MKKKIGFKPKAIIFDMDGVIVDSMPYHYIAWYEALIPYGIRVTAYDAYSREGERWQKTLDDLFKRQGKKITPAISKKIFDHRSRIFKKYFKASIFPGIEEFLKCTKKKGYYLALVTGTPLREVKKILPQKIRSYFKTVVSGDKVTCGKPHPEPYLLAAKILKLKPKECVVIENAPLGIRSAKSAGMFCFAVTTSLPGEYLKKADIVVEKLEDISGIIERSCACLIKTS